MSLNVAQARLKDAYKELNQRWNRLDAIWRDAAHDEFERQYLAQLRRRVMAASTAMDHMAEVIRKARRDCG